MKENGMEMVSLKHEWKDSIALSTTSDSGI